MKHEMMSIFKWQRFYIIFLLLFIFSCHTASKVEQKEITKEVYFSFNIGDQSADSDYIKVGCNIINSTDQIPVNFAYVNFFHVYMKFKSYLPEYLKYFDCREKLENQASYLLALNREPLNKIDYNSNIDDYTLHREIIRNLYKIVTVIKDNEGRNVRLSGVSDGKLYDSADDEDLKNISDTKLFLKFYSELDEKSGNYRDFYIPVKNYKLVKEYLIKLNQPTQKNEAAKYNFALSYSSLMYLLPSQPVKNKELSWIEEINIAPYYSTDPILNLFISRNRALNNNYLFTAYSYNSRLFYSNILLTKIIRETGILPKNFSAIPLIEKSLKSGSKEYCVSIPQPQELNKLKDFSSQKLKVAKLFTRYCSNKSEAKQRGNEMDILKFNDPTLRNLSL